MKVGAQDKKKLYAMAVLLTLAVVLSLRVLIVGAGTPTVTASAPAPGVAQTEAAGAGGTRGKGAPPPLDPTLRVDLLKNSEGAQYKGSGRNIFEAKGAPPPEPQRRTPPVPIPITQPNPINTPPPPPPIPLKFFGFANEPGQPKSIFLANGDDIFIGHEGEIVNRRYKILRISATQVEIEDVLNNHRETIPLTQG